VFLISLLDKIFTLRSPSNSQYVDEIVVLNPASQKSCPIAFNFGEIALENSTIIQTPAGTEGSHLVTLRLN